MNFLKIIRWPNLLFLQALLALVYYALVQGILLKYGGIPLDYSTLLFVLLSVSTVFTAAGGYVVNDYFDTRIDQINRPLRVIVGNGMSRQQAAVYFQVLFGIGMAAGLGLAVWLRDLTLVFIYIGIPGLLWFYSSSYKRLFLLGNLMIALCAFLSVFLVGYVVNVALVVKYKELIYQTPVIPEIYCWTAGIGLFSALFTLLREIVKDAEDVEGDREMECRTLPIVWGLLKTKITLTVLSLCTLLLAAWFCFVRIPLLFPTDPFTRKYYLLGIVLPMVAFLLLLGKAKHRRDWHQLSLLLKFIMAIGSVYCLLVYYLLLIN